MVNSNFPKYYFKFFSFGEHVTDTIEKLLDNKIYTPSITQLNDPFEGRWYGNQIDAKYPGEDKELYGTLCRRRVFCLCTSNSENFPLSSDSILMWSHYANSHKGFCVMFSKHILGADGQESFSPQMIDYSESMEERTGNIDKDMSILCRKSVVWKYEHELRLCFKNTKSRRTPSFYRNIPPKSIIAIFAGCQISQQHECLLYGLSRRLECDYYKIEMSNEFYRLNKILIYKSNSQ